jgi:methionyl aminopeptidase
MIYKSKREIDLMRKAGEVVALSHKKIEEVIAPGIKTIELDKIVEEFILSCGAIPSFKGYSNPMPGEPNFPSSICASVNNEVVHGIPNDRELKEGDILSVDIGAYLNGYHGDAARTFRIGKVSKEADKLINATEESFYKGIEKAVLGNRIVDISTAIEKCIKNYGFSIVKDLVGHGIGRELHESPQIPNYKTKERGPRVNKGMTLAIEPMVNEGSFEVIFKRKEWTVVTKDGSLSAHYENTIAVTEKEPIILTKVD